MAMMTTTTTNNKYDSKHQQPLLLRVLAFFDMCMAPYNSQEESILEGGKGLAVAAFEGVMWTAVRWWGGGLDRAR